jgi:hypothetical protein
MVGWRTGLPGTVCTTNLARRPGATVIWTRHRRPPDLTRSIRSWFAAGGFEEVAFDQLDNQYLASVGVHRLTSRRPLKLPAPEQPLFTFASRNW